ncbi:MAG TPA: hypothetical protein DF383_07860, partial [Deltaproteobacteria bacterium]|nr:hypothetical protein [Deltaproteobacteria bacterium]
MNSVDELKKQLHKAAALRDPVDRISRIAWVIAQALQTVGQDPILVGGAAVEFYTKGGYSTCDIDMIAPGGPELAQVMAQLGLQQIGKDYIDKQYNIYIEFPSSELGPNEKFTQLKIDGGSFRIISIEDLIVDRLCSFKFWKSAVDGVNALLLAEMVDHNEVRLRERAKEEHVLDAWEVILQVREEV